MYLGLDRVLALCVCVGGWGVELGIIMSSKSLCFTPNNLLNGHGAVAL